MKRGIALLALAGSVAAGASALPAGPSSFMADDGGLWHFEDNPALIPAATAWDSFMLGASYDTAGATGIAPAGAGFGDVRLAGVVPILGYYDLTMERSSVDFLGGSGLSFGKVFSIGGDFDWSSASSSIASFGMGLLLRPASFLSVGLTGEYDAAIGAYDAGFGLALRPLALAGASGRLSRALTLDADMSWAESTGFGFENIGLRLLLSDIADIRAWYAPPGGNAASGSLGLELRLALGPAGISVMTPAATGSSIAWRAGGDIDLRLSDLAARSSSLPASSFGRRILLVKDIDAIDPDRARSDGDFALFSSRRTLALPALLDLLERARRDKGVAAVAFEKLPPLGGVADYQEFAAELGALRKAGKKVYLYGERFDRDFAILAGQADAISLDPLGSLELSGLGFHRAYLKPLFDSLGIRFVSLAPWDTKSAFNNLTDSSMPAGEEAMMRRLYGDLQEQLGLSLAAGRGEKLPGGPEAALQGGPYLTASDALKAGLVDSVAYAGEFEDSLRKSYPGARLVSGFGAPLGESWGGPAFRRRAAIVWLSGSIGEGKGRAGREIGSGAALEIERLRKDGSVAGIVLRIDSPGGSALMSDVIAREVRLAVEAGKPVVVSMGHYAASGGYYIAAPASWIVAEPATITGSIGVTGVVPNISETLRKLGVNYEGFDLTPGASFLDPGKKLDDGELARMNAMMLSIYDSFVGVVAAGRKMDAEAVRKIGEGRIWTGREARTLGLVDELGGLAEAKAWLESKLGSRLDFVDLLPGEASPFLPSLIGLSSAIKAAVGQGDESALESLIGPATERIQRLLDMGRGPVYYLDADSLDF